MAVGSSWGFDVSQNVAGVTTALRGVSGSDTNSFEGWDSLVVAVGDGGVVLHSVAGGTFTRVPVPTQANLRGVWIRDPSYGWIVGDGGTVLQWKGESWSLVASPTTRNLFAVDGNVMVGEYNTVLSLHWSGKLMLEDRSAFGPLPSAMYVEPNPTWHVDDASTFPVRFDQTQYIDSAADIQLLPVHLYAVSSRGEELFFTNELKNAGAGGSVPSALTLNPNGAALVVSPDNWHVGTLRFYTGSA